jgi:hypothetical protein
MLSAKKLSLGTVKSGDSFAVAFRGYGKPGVTKRSAIAARIDGIHDRQRTAYTEHKAEHEPKDGTPMEFHVVSVTVAGGYFDKVQS